MFMYYLYTPYGAGQEIFISTQPHNVFSVRAYAVIQAILQMLLILSPL